MIDGWWLYLGLGLVDMVVEFVDEVVDVGFFGLFIIEEVLCM